MYVSASHCFPCWVPTCARFLDFETHFKEVHRKQARSDRSFFVHVTSVVVSGRLLSSRGDWLDLELTRSNTGYQGHNGYTDRGGR